NNNNYGEQEDRYLFSSKEVKYRNGNRMNRITKSGYWKATGSDKRIISTSCNNNNNSNIVGIRKTLVFYHGKSPNGSRTHWIMREYRLVTTHSNSSQINLNIYSQDSLAKHAGMFMFMLGTDNWLFDKSRRLSLGADKLDGISPESLFEDKFNELSVSKDLIPTGISPERELPE
ncbi:hypothetical protein S83_062968, partial [Arachis hypogaea]